MPPRKPSIYLASPLFSQVERKWNRTFAEMLGEEMPDYSIILPQDFRIEGKFNDQSNFGRLFERCRSNLEKSSAVVAVLDGADTDSGVAFEVGLAFAKDIPVVGVRTDYRPGQDRGLNLMLGSACASVVREYSFQEDTAQLAAAVARRLQKCLVPER